MRNPTIPNRTKMYLTVTKRFEFSASHRCHRSDWSDGRNLEVWGPESRGEHGHGHNYVAYLALHGPLQSSTGMIVDIATVKSRVLELLAGRYDHKYLNANTVDFKLSIPTTEVVARQLLDDASALFAGEAAEVVACRLIESPENGATVFADERLTRDLSFNFSAARRTFSPHLSDEENMAMFGIAAAPEGHGHSYRVRIVLEGPVDETTGLTVPYARSAEVLSSLHDELDHRNLNLNVPGLAGGPITTEVLARYIYDRASQALPLSHICLWENDSFFIECHGGDLFRMSYGGRFNAAHRLHSRSLSDDENIRLYGKCNNEQGHGHQYDVEGMIESGLDERTGTCFDLGRLDRIMTEVLSEYDYKHLDQESADFADCPSTGENIVSSLWKKFEIALEGKLSRVRLWETPNNLFTMRRESPLRDR